MSYDFNQSKIDDEFCSHREKEDSNNLYFGQVGEANHAHASLDFNGNLQFLREENGDVAASFFTKEENELRRMNGQW